MDLPERGGRKRSASGFAAGSNQLHYRTRRETFVRSSTKGSRGANPGSERVAELEQILASIHVVDPTDAPASSVTFGATVTVQDKKGATETFTIVGVERTRFRTRRGELDLFTRKALLNAEMGDWITLGDGQIARIVEFEAQLIGDA